MLNKTILTETEKKVIQRRINNEKLTKQDSYYLSVSIRPKLREMISIDAESLLNQLEYNRKAISIEKNIKKIITKEIDNTEAIILFGSAIQTNYKEYNDIDILITTKKKNYKTLIDKCKKINEIKEKLKEKQIIADIQIYDKKTLKDNYSRNPSLIYQLKDSKTIYGELKLDKKIELHNIDLKMKLDWSDIEDDESNGNDIYNAIRNVILVRLLLNRIVDNKKLKESLYEELGKNMIERLKYNLESKLDKKIAMDYLKNILKKTENEIKDDLWEKIVV